MAWGKAQANLQWIGNMNKVVSHSDFGMLCYCSITEFLLTDTDT